MKIKAVLAISMLIIAGCQSTEQLEPISKIKHGVVNEGSLANEKLIADTTLGLKHVLGNEVITPNTKIIKFVIQQPVGKPGARAWREMWVVNPEGSGSNFLITFKEAGFGAADFEIQPMGNKK